MILGDWLRHDYISVGFEDPEQISRKRFDEMRIGDKVVVVTDKYIWAIGEIKGKLYEKDEPELYSYRRDVVWYKVTRLGYENFPASLKNKLSRPHTVVPLERDDWQVIQTYLA